MTASPDETLTTLFDEHYRGLCRLATLLLDDPDLAEEAVQEAFVRTFAGWWRIRRQDRVEAYLRAAVVNQCRTRGRRRGREQLGNRRAWATVAEGSPSREIETAGEVLAVLGAVRELPMRQREAIVLHYYADLPEAQVARAMGCTVGTVKSQLSKARASLAARLGPEPGRDGGGSRPLAPSDETEERAGA